MTLPDATRYAEELRARLEPFCAPGQCVIAGSVRRKSMAPNDIEIVATPILNDPAKFFPLRELVNGGKLGSVKIGKFPSRYTRVEGPYCQLDLFWQSRESFGLNYWIRTGPADYAKRGLSFWKRITNGGYSEGAKLFLPGGECVPTLTEEAVYEAFTKYAGKRVPWLDPEKRV